MKKIPPHLPVSSCNLRNHQIWMRLKVLILIVFISIIAGIAGASVMVGWLWPYLGGGEILISAYQRPSFADRELEEIVKKEIQNRIVSVYSRSGKMYNIDYLTHDDLIGEGIIVSSDGWVAMYGTKPLISQATVVYSQDKLLYEVEKTYFDKYSKINYIKLKSTKSEFKVVPFVNSINEKEEAYVLNELKWDYSILGSLDWNKKILPRYDADASYYYHLDGSYGASKIVINKQGRVLGFTTNEGNLLPSEFISRGLTQLLSNNAINYASLGITGWNSWQRPIIIEKKGIKGFFVYAVQNPKSLLKAGDVIVEVNGNIVNDFGLWYIISKETEVTLKVIRNKKEITIVAPIIKI